jgi:hypothetical protein
MCRLDAEQVKDAARQAERANRMELCVTCGTPYDGGTTQVPGEPAFFRGGTCPDCFHRAMGER